MEQQYISDCNFRSIFTCFLKQYTTSRPEVVGADHKPPNTDFFSSDVSELAFDVRKYKQTTPQIQSHANLVSDL